MKKQIYIYRTRTLTQHEFVVKCVKFAVEFQDTLCHTHTLFFEFRDSQSNSDNPSTFLLQKVMAFHLAGVTCATWELWGDYPLSYLPADPPGCCKQQCRCMEDWHIEDASSLGTWASWARAMVGRSAHFFRWPWAGEPQNSDLWMSIPARSYKTRGVDFLSDDCCWSVSWADKFPDFQTLTKPVDKQWHHARSFLFLNSFHEASAGWTTNTWEIKVPKTQWMLSRASWTSCEFGGRRWHRPSGAWEVAGGIFPQGDDHPLLMGIPIPGDWGIPWCDHMG